jgi:ubiquinone/menaquinone biosynthesis C-methylase UbiE
MTYRAKEHYRDDAVADAYDAERFTSLKGRLVDRREQGLIRGMIERAGARPPASVMDVPCGTGRLMLSLATAGFQVTGVDVSEQMIARAVARCASLPATLRPTVAVSDAEALPFADGAFDVVASLRLMGHLPPPTRIQVLRELGRVTKRHVIVAYYHRASVQSMLRRRQRRVISWHPVTLAQIDAELRAAGLRRIGRRFMLPLVSETVVVLAETA